MFSVIVKTTMRHTNGSLTPFVCTTPARRDVNPDLPEPSFTERVAIRLVDSCAQNVCTPRKLIDETKSKIIFEATVG